MLEAVADLAPVDEVEADDAVHAGEAVVVDGEADRLRQIGGGGRTAPGQRLDIAEFAKARRGDAGAAGLPCAFGRLAQQDRAFVVKAPDRVDQCGAEFERGARLQVPVLQPFGLIDRAAQAVDAGIGGPGRQARRDPTAPAS